MTSVSQHIRQILGQLPERPGVYQYLNSEGTIIYVGKAKNLKRRVSSYFQKEHEWIKTRQLVKQIADIHYVVVDTEQDAFLLENNLIKQYQPHYNILLKDGKSYPSICITREPYPRIFKTRKIIRGVGTYYGPYSYGNTVDLVIELIHALYPLRTCTSQMTEKGVAEGKYRTCLKYHLGRCSGICEQKIANQEYAAYIEQAKKIIRGDAQQLRDQILEQIQQYAERFEYEKAGEEKRKLELLEKFCSKTVITNSAVGDLDVFGYDEQDDNVYISMLHCHNGSITQGQTIEYKKQLDESKEEILAHGIIELKTQLGSLCNEAIVPFIPDLIDEKLHLYIAVSGDKKRLLDLAMQNVQQYKKDCLRQADRLNPDQRTARLLTEVQQLLHLQNMPLFIDSFDNSHIQGSNAVGGCVVFRKGKPSKKEYKRFSIHHTEGNDDYASMREIVRRRYQDILDENGELPQLIIADGGIGQMNAIREVIEQQLQLSIPIAGLKKDDKHRTNTLLFGNPVQELSLKVTDEVFRLMVQIQDEVHRFAISYHKNKRSKAQNKSQLDDIQGVGEKSKQKILLHFHSIERARKATETEWKNLLGNSLGSKCYAYFQANLSL